jgi:hypothetical protein
MKDQTEIFEAKYPVKDFNKTTYSFDSQELRKLSSLDTIDQMGQMAQMMISQFVSNECLPRVGAKNSPDTGVLYDIGKGQFVIFTPKVWCISCNKRRGLLEYGGKNYCEECFDLKKTIEAGKGKVAAEERIKPEVKEVKK